MSFGQYGQVPGNPLGAPQQPQNNFNHPGNPQNNTGNFGGTPTLDTLRNNVQAFNARPGMPGSNPSSQPGTNMQPQQAAYGKAENQICQLAFDTKIHTM